MKHARIGIAAALCIVCLLGATLGLAGCAPQSPRDTNDSPEAKDPVTSVEFAWTPDADCSMCHTTESASMTDQSCLASTHEKEGNTCATCHTDTAGLEKAHEGATPELAEKKATKLRDTTIDENSCFSCHGSYEELASETADSTVLADSQGTVVNPHAIPDSEDHADTDCSSCHVMHSDEPDTESAPEYCISCHHANVYQCHTCHQ